MVHKETKERLLPPVLQDQVVVPEQKVNPDKRENQEIRVHREPQEVLVRKES